MRRKLKEVCDFYSGTGFPVKYQGETDGELPFYKVGDIANNATVGNVYLSLCNNYVSHGVAKEIKGTIIPANVVVFAKIGEALKLNRRAITVGDCLIDNNAMGIGGKQEYLNSMYFYFFMKNLKMETLAESTTVPSVRKSKLEEIEMEVPSLQEQTEIVDILAKLQKMIKERQEQLDKLDELIKARFVELFGDPKINEKNWNTGIVSQFYEVKGGKRIPKGMGYADGITAHPYLRATDMKNETILDDDIHYIDEAVFEKIKRYTVKGGDIYLTNVGVNLGMAGVIPDKYDGANLTENAVKLVPKTDVVLDGLFLAHYINSPGIQDYINKRKMSVGVPKLAIFRIETMPLILPPMNLQIEFINFCKQADKSKVAIQKVLAETQMLFDSLMQEYFG